MEDFVNELNIHPSPTAGDHVEHNALRDVFIIIIFFHLRTAPTDSIDFQLELDHYLDNVYIDLHPPSSSEDLQLHSLRDDVDFFDLGATATVYPEL